MLGQARAAGNRRIAETLAPERLRGTRDGPRISAGINLFPLLGYGLLIVAVVLVLRVLVVIFRRD